MHAGSMKVRRLGRALERGQNVNGQKNSRGKTTLKCMRARHCVTKRKTSKSTRVPAWMSHCHVRIHKGCNRFEFKVWARGFRDGSNRP